MNTKQCEIEIIHGFVSSSTTSVSHLWLAYKWSKMQLPDYSLDPLWCHVTPLLSSLHCLPLKFRFKFKVSLFTFRALHSQMPSFNRNPCTNIYRITWRSLSSSDLTLVVPCSRPGLCIRPEG